MSQEDRNHSKSSAWLGPTLSAKSVIRFSISGDLHSTHTHGNASLKTLKVQVSNVHKPLSSAANCTSLSVSGTQAN